ncbi:MAG TPA: hypothetical protein VGR03_11130 [Candidatus Acidoferrum sp.]|nr:hypothetical protein [Candidatus Acidoferrum sp.]
MKFFIPFALSFIALVVLFAPGIAPVLADATVYVLLVVVDYAVMRMVVGSAQGDSLARGRSGARKNGPSEKG